MSMIVRMVQKDIDDSAEYAWGFASVYDCPIAMGLKRHGHKDVYVDSHQIKFDGDLYVCDMNINLWISDLLIYGHAKPIDIEFVESEGNHLGYATIA